MGSFLGDRNCCADNMGGYPSVTWTITNKPFTNVQSEDYWSSTTHAEDSALAWEVTISGGNVYNDIQQKNHNVWQVRGGN
jgi:hypothetical protein